MPDKSPADLAKNNSFDFLDHIVWGCQDLEKGCSFIADLAGTTPVYGGVHEGRGTHNALLGLGEKTYLEIVAPDPAQVNNKAPIWMNITPQYNFRIIGWAAKSNDLARTLVKAEQAKTQLGEVEAGSRKQTDGNLLSWRLTLPVFGNGIGTIPFFVDWGQSAHPAPLLPQAGQIFSMTISHPLPEKLGRHLETLETPVPCIPGPAAITLQLITASGRTIEL